MKSSIGHAHRKSSACMEALHAVRQHWLIRSFKFISLHAHDHSARKGMSANTEENEEERTDSLSSFGLTE